MKAVLRISAFMAVLLLSGCATLSKEECLTVDWREVGYTDGSSGREFKRIAEHREACAKYGVRVDLDQYHAGRAEGLKSFCQASSGFARGRQGYVYSGICPSDLEPGFLDGYEEGRDIYDVEHKISKLQGKISNHENRIKKLKKKIKEKEDALLADGTSSEDRRKIYKEIDELKEELHENDFDREEIERQIYHLELKKEDLISRSRHYH